VLVCVCVCVCVCACARVCVCVCEFREVHLGIRTGPNSRRDDNILWIQNFQKKHKSCRDGSFCSTLEVNENYCL